MDSRHSARYASAMTTSRPVARFLDRSTAPHVATLVAVTDPALAMNIFLPSLPAMTDWFATDYRLMQLSVSLYLGVSAGLQIVIGPISTGSGVGPSFSGPSFCSSSRRRVRFSPRLSASSSPSA